MNKHYSNQSKAIVICDHKSDKTWSVAHVNKAYLVWLMFRVLSNQHYQHRTNQKLRSWANAVFQNRGVCGQAVPSFPSPSPVIPFIFCSRPNFSRTNSRGIGNACYAGYPSTNPYISNNTYFRAWVTCATNTRFLVFTGPLVGCTAVHSLKRGVIFFKVKFRTKEGGG